MSGIHRPAKRPGSGAPKLLDTQTPLNLKELRAELGTCWLRMESSLGLGVGREAPALLTSEGP